LPGNVEPRVNKNLLTAYVDCGEQKGENSITIKKESTNKNDIN
jgi:hypothetical protein